MSKSKKKAVPGKSTQHFKNWLEKYCHNKGNLEELANITGISKSTLSRYKKTEEKSTETDEHNEERNFSVINSIPIDSVAIIAEKLNMNPADLVGWNWSFDATVKEGKDILACIIALLSEVEQRNALAEQEGSEEENLITYEMIEKVINDTKESYHKKKKPRPAIDENVFKIYELLRDYSLEDSKKILQWVSKRVINKKL